ncbi:hypothetical protein [Maribacter aestuarii]|uniref:hypothetical protein n=1 Tax=Maribacter aestuarii TaxID=1130723 RepID=UPI00248B70C8|nr:hypothetical protein [Maribacter aestuarii]
MGKCPYCNKSAGIFKKHHKECEEKYNRAKANITKTATENFEDLNNLNFDQLKELAKESYVSESEYQDIISESYLNVLDQYLDDGVLSKEEEDRLESFMKNSNLSQEVFDKNDSLSKTVRASILRDLLNGDEIKNRLKVNGNLPFKFQKSENLIWLFQNVELFEQRIKTTYKGGSQGLSLRIAKGIYYRTNSFRGHPVKTTKIVPIATGIVALTEKHIYFASSIKNFRINYNKIITIDPYSDGIGITKDGVTAKPQVFKNVDGWFCYNFIKNISE